MHGDTKNHLYGAQRIILYCAYAEQQGYETIRIRTPHSDVFFIALHHATKFAVNILLEIGTGRKKKLLSISQLAQEYGQKICTALMCLNAKSINS